MSKQITIGGGRLGAGGKMTEKLHGYGSSHHDLGHVFKSSMTVGTLVPFFVQLMTNGDHATINLTSLIRTHPTVGAMFGNFKAQMDVFKIPMRYYIKALHNNKKGIGMQMDKVYFPKMSITARNPNLTQPNLNQQQIDPASLLHYLGIKGLGKGTTTPAQNATITRAFNAIPMLAYWDIYANYYANLQEGIGVAIGATVGANPWIQNVVLLRTDDVFDSWEGQLLVTKDPQYNVGIPALWTISLRGESLSLGQTNIQVLTAGNIPTVINLGSQQARDIFSVKLEQSADGTQINMKSNGVVTLCSTPTQAGVSGLSGGTAINREIVLNTFDIKNIDTMRENLLSASMATAFDVTTQEYAPYNLITGVVQEGGQPVDSVSKGVMAGLAIKTYQSDRFNNWLSQEFIDGANGVTELSSIDVTDGKLKMDDLNLQQKIYNLLNRVVLSGGSYRDWQEAVYAHRGTGELEIPEYLGGMSADIGFNEVISNSAAEFEGEPSPLGTLGGRGVEQNQKGNTIKVTANEPCFIMGIVSLTPRLDYSQGNEWWNRLETMDDLHKPELDGIGFQELITDEMAAWDTNIDPTNNMKITLKSAGKQPAWIEYTTDTNKVHGNFVNGGSEKFMVLNRGYKPDENGNISDLTTYIDPTKYSTPFAKTDLAEQHFWVQIGIQMQMSRVMAASQIPQL